MLPSGLVQNCCHWRWWLIREADSFARATSGQRVIAAPELGMHMEPQLHSCQSRNIATFARIALGRRRKEEADGNVCLFYNPLAFGAEAISRVIDLPTPFGLTIIICHKVDDGGESLA